MMLEPGFANVVQQFLHVRNLPDACSAERLQRIVCEFSFTHVSANRSVEVIGGEAGIGHCPGFDSADTGAEGVVLTDGSGNDLLEVHAYVAEEVLWKVAAVEADGFVGIVAVVVVPVQKGTGSFRCERQCMHAHHAADIDFASAGDEAIAHHAHDGARHDSEIRLQRRPALNSADLDIGFPHPPVDYCTQLRHLDESRLGNSAGRDVFLDVCNFSDDGSVVVGKTVDAAENFSEVNRFHRDAALLQNLLTEADGVEVRRASADGADAKVAQAVHDAASGCKIL